MAVVTLSISELISMTGLGKQKILDGLNEIGAPIDDEKDDEIYAEVTPNRPDLFSVEGAARALNSFYGKKPKVYSVKKSDLALIVEPSVQKVRPYIVAALVKNVTIDDNSLKSIIQLQEKLHDTIGRKRKKTAIGIHNADEVVFPLVYKAVKEETFVPLDFDVKMTAAQILAKHPKGMAYSHLVKGAYPMLYDKKGVLSFPPIINSERTRVDVGTKNLFIDITGTNLKTLQGTLNIICCAFADRGGEVVQVNIGKISTPNLDPQRMDLDIGGINALLGEKFSSRQIFDYLERMGWLHDKEVALVPPYRMDIWHYSDAAEDVAIAHGYNNFKPSLPGFFTPGSLAQNYEGVRDALVGMGFVEMVNYSLTNREVVDGKPALKIINPKTEEFTVMRMRIAESLLDNLVINKTHELPIKIFEIGRIYEENERVHLGFAVSMESVDFSSFKGILQTLSESMENKLSFKPSASAFFIKGRGADIYGSGKKIGFIGEVAPEKLFEMGILNPVGICELNLD